ncbi:hypothetical protein C9374_009468 [Naegleria lovaniensis]|uniref:Uncharacterized protein n=1 Tax=Naegleria lovaniensis TaxID=51637 RepID=A0AA88H4W5_NAELO|nr:uncharacterized protein C9374_009468 [Naegleria lovaniensis]KAG2392891.1 hypothetical protein C9374_009468 [Naegleria lovaniensis]
MTFQIPFPNFLKKQQYLFSLGLLSITLSVILYISYQRGIRKISHETLNHLIQRRHEILLEHRMEQQYNDQSPSMHLPSTTTDTSSSPSTRKNKGIVYPITFINQHLENALTSNVLRSNCQVYLASYYSFNEIGKVMPTYIGQERVNIYGHWKKYIILQKFLNSQASSYIDEEDYIFFSDGLDVMFYDHLQNAIEIYWKYLKDEGIDVERDRELNWPLLFNAEKNRAPSPKLFIPLIKNMNVQTVVTKYVRKENYPVRPYCNAQSTFKFLNSGMYMARKRDVKAYLQKAFENTIDPNNIHNDDQAMTQYMYVTQQLYPVIGDCNATLAIPTIMSCESIKVDMKQSKCEISNGFKEESKNDDQSFTTTNGSERRERPVAIHSIGKQCPEFCPCLQAIIQSGRLQENLEREMKKHKMKDMYQLEEKFGVIVYNSDHDSVRIQPILDFCGSKTLFDPPSSQCVYKTY